MSNFTFFHNIFYAICILKSFSSHISVVICSFFEFGTVSKWFTREWVKTLQEIEKVPLTSVSLLYAWEVLLCYGPQSSVCLSVILSVYLSNILLTFCMEAFVFHKQILFFMYHIFFFTEAFVFHKPILLAPLAIGWRAYVMVCCLLYVRPSGRLCVRPSVRALTFSLNIFFSETTYQILMKFYRNVPAMVLFRIY